MKWIINDALWFDSDSIYKDLGMMPDTTTTHDAGEIDAAARTVETWRE